MSDNQRLSASQHRSSRARPRRRCETMQGLQAVGAVVLLVIVTINIRFLIHTHNDRVLRRGHHLPGWSVNDASAHTQDKGHDHGVNNNNRPRSRGRHSRHAKPPLKTKVVSNRTEEILSIFQQPAPWRQSKVIPRWMKDYMQWHQDQRAALTADNWNNGTFRFLVVRCSKVDNKCGGTADRLKPMPYYFLVANHLKRVLFIWWEVPAPLEFFLEPPSVDGIDLRLPSFLLEIEKAENRLRAHVPDIYGSRDVQAVLGYTEPGQEEPRQVNQRKTRFMMNHILPTETLVTIRFQTHDHGANEYNNLRVQYPFMDPVTNETVQPLHLAKTDDEVEASFEEVFRDVWYSCLIPVPAIQQRIAEQMSSLGLYRNNYNAIHIRSRYHVKAQGHRLDLLCENAVHCLYKLDAQKASTRPIYVSADHRSAVWTTLQYSHKLSLHHVTAREKNLILSLSRQQAMQDESGILHLDRGSNHLARNAKDFTTSQFEAHEYYDTFVDVYILSQADCITFNVGNYGKWANLLSDNRQCRISHMGRKCDASDLVLPVVKEEDDDDEGE
eukprot:scaffold568_cov160-Amphora_coffeaeformis.AAC.2